MSDNVSKVYAFKRPIGTSKRRVSVKLNALDTLQGVGFSKDCEVDIATGGQFSIVDAIEAVLDYTGPADVLLATWTAAQFDLTQIEQQLITGNIRDLRLIIDRSFVNRQPVFVERILERFGADSVCATRTHAKFVVVHNEDWHVVLRTSMNLNHNARLEFLQVTESEELARFWLDIGASIFADSEGVGGKWAAPDLEGVEAVTLEPPVRVGEVGMSRQGVRVGGGRGA